MLYVGCCGFCVARSRYYSLFNAVEIQETFYELPSLDRLERYRKEAPEGFVFTIKAWQAITHPLDSPTWKRAKRVPDKTLKDKYGFLRPTKEVFDAWEKVVEAAKAVNARVIVVQTPPSFGYTEENYRNAIEFFSVADSSGFVVGWEPRGSWLENLSKVGEIVSRFKNIIHVVDPLRFTPVVDKPVAYFRLHGLGPGEVNYRYKYTDEDLDRLCEMATDFLAKSRGVYIMFNNIHMASDASRFKERCRQHHP